MSNLAFYSADTLGMTLYALEGLLKGSEIRKLRLGPWRLEFEVSALSDLMTAKEITYFVKVGKALKLYVIVREKEAWVLVLNAEKLKEIGARTGFAGETVRERILELKPAMGQVFCWTETTKWKPVIYDGANVGG